MFTSYIWWAIIVHSRIYFTGSRLCALTHWPGTHHHMPSLEIETRWNPSSLPLPSMVILKNRIKDNDEQVMEQGCLPGSTPAKSIKQFCFTIWRLNFGFLCPHTWTYLIIVWTFSTNENTICSVWILLHMARQYNLNTSVHNLANDLLLFHCSPPPSNMDYHPLLLFPQWAPISKSAELNSDSKNLELVMSVKAQTLWEHKPHICFFNI